jgi:hypothetical protein
MLFVQVLAPCRLVGRRQRLEETYFRAPAVKKEKVCFFETLASTDEATRRQNPGEEHIILTAVKTSNLTIRAYFIINANWAVPVT